MLALIIWGTKGVTSTVASGQFTCPGCQQQTHYEHKRVRRFFSLYWIPIFPIATVGEFVECLSCRGTWKQGVLGP